MGRTSPERVARRAVECYGYFATGTHNHCHPDRGLQPEWRDLALAGRKLHYPPRELASSTECPPATPPAGGKARYFPRHGAWLKPCLDESKSQIAQVHCKGEFHGHSVYDGPFRRYSRKLRFPIRRSLFEKVRHLRMCDSEIVASNDNDAKNVSTHYLGVIPQNLRSYPICKSFLALFLAGPKDVYNINSFLFIAGPGLASTT